MFVGLASAITAALGAARFDPSIGADYFVSTTGSDANDGLTPATPKATIQAVKALFDAASGDTTVYVAPGTYKGGPDFPSGTVYASRRKITYYMAGVTVDNQDDAAANFANNLRAYAQNLTLEVVGPCTFTTAANDNVNFGGTYAAGSECIVICRDVSMIDPGPGGGAAGDCFSGHGNSIGYAYDCTFTTNNNKSCVAHVEETRTYHYRCTFNCGVVSLGSVVVSGTALLRPVAYFEDCVFKAQAADVQSIRLTQSALGEAEFVRCQFIKDGGTWANNVANGQNSRVKFYDCYAEDLETEGSDGSVFQRCYGDWKIRLGRGNGTEADVTIENCVFKRSGSPVLEWHFYDGGAQWNGGAGGTIRNNIFMDASTAISCVTTAGAIARVNAIWSFENNLFFNNTANYTSGLTPDGTDVTGQNPLLVTGAGSNQSNWKVQAGSPAIGAGTGGGNIGLGVA